MESSERVSAPRAHQGEKRLNVFERYLSLWVAACMIAGVLIGKYCPGLVGSIRGLEFGRGSQINLPIAVLIWLMIVPMMMKIDFLAIREVGKNPKGLLVTLFVNWMVKPFSMALIFLVFPAARIFGVAHSGGSESIRGGHDYSGGSAVHRDGVCMELSDRRRSGIHAGAGVAE